MRRWNTGPSPNRREPQMTALANDDDNAPGQAHYRNWRWGRSCRCRRSRKQHSSIDGRIVVSPVVDPDGTQSASCSTTRAPSRTRSRSATKMLAAAVRQRSARSGTSRSTRGTMVVSGLPPGNATRLIIRLTVPARRQRPTAAVAEAGERPPARPAPAVPAGRQARSNSVRLIKLASRAGFEPALPP
jgi:hypothetical protein